MRCKTCDYALWTLKARSCPECGSPFKPSDFEFVPNSVRFCCPHCDQEYYGTDANGHLVPKEFVCVQCSAQVRMDEMVLRPAEGVDESQTRMYSNPWLNRQREGSWRGLFQTIGMSMTSPGALMRSTPPDQGHGRAWLFAVIVQFAIGLLVSLPYGLLVGGMGMAVGGGGMGNIGFVLGSMLSYGLFFFVGSMTNLAIWGLVTHGILHLTGGCARGMARTFDALCYSSGANVLTVIPCVGPYIGWIWWVVSAVLMVKEGQRVSGGRASLAVLTFPVLMVLTCVGGYAALVAASLSGMGGWSAMVTQTVEQTEAQRVTTALVDYINQNGSAPPHAAQLMVTDQLFAWDFLTTNGATSMPDVPVGNTDLQSLSIAPKHVVIKAANEATAALPVDVVAHRLGNFVFTYHGVDFATTDPLWVVVLSRDPDVGGNGAQMTYCAGLVDGSVVVIDAVNLQAELSAQNALRASHGLPPLPAPATVTHASPAQGGWVEGADEASGDEGDG